MSRFGWSGIVAFGVALGILASAIHWKGGVLPAIRRDRLATAGAAARRRSELDGS